MRSKSQPSLICAHIVTLVTVLVSTTIAFAGDSGHGHDAGGIPFSVTLQAINFALYLGLLVFFLRKPVRNYFKSREENYRQSLVKAEHAKREAEQKKSEISARMAQLEGTSRESVERARAEAAALLSQIEQQGREMAERLRSDAARAVEIELDRARAALRQDMLTEAVALSKKMLTDKMAEPDQKRLQTEFVDKIREVHA